MKRTLGIALLLLGLVAVGCGGGDDGGDGDGLTGPPPGGGGGGNTFTATIDGAAWSSDKNLIFVTGANPATREGTLTISGYQASTQRTVLLMLSFIIGPASQPLGVNVGTNPGGAGSITYVSDIWQTPLSGQAGFVNITARTDKRIAGTFNFTADGLLPGMTPPARTLTNGKFDITIDIGLPPLPTGVGSTSIASIAGVPFNGATIVGSNIGGGLFSLSVATTKYMIVFTTATATAAGNPYGIGSQIQLQVTDLATADGWAAVVGPDVGTMNISTFDTNRLIATYNATLPKLGGGAPLVITGGTVNAYLAAN